MSAKVTRLFEQFHPDTYDLTLDVNRDEMLFSGSVTITGAKVGRPSKRITLHQKELKITSATLTKHDKTGDKEIVISRINNQDSFDEVRLHSDSLIFPGKYTITLQFKGMVTRPMNGMYPCFYTHEGVDKKLIATQFESHHAREAFPCIDEPEAKATFILTLKSPPGEVALSNTPIASQKTDGNALVTTFEQTPKMSTYLLAFIFGDMGYKEATTKDGVVVRTFATPDNVVHTEFALECAVKTLEFYNEYFDIPYPLEKCDFIALPDFASGAMENWGCITFREQALLVDPKNTSLHLKQYVANVVAHELTHQWFGNLVTMRWWTDLWLNESFASWMSWLAVDHLFPEWKVWNHFIVDEQGFALKLDALEHTHPIEVEVRHPDEIRTIFDAISYEKGASVLLMLHEYLGKTDFRDGVRLYLQKHAYGNTDTVDLWNAFSEVSKKPVSTFMHVWTSASGYPIVSAKVNFDSVSITQERFYLNQKANKEATQWPIPLLSGGALANDTLEKTDKTYSIAVHPSDVLLNHDRTGFYRVIYDARHIASLAEHIKKGSLSELDRLGLLSDGFEAAKAGYGSTVDALTLLAAYSNESSSVVWDVIAGNLVSIRVVMDDESMKPGLKKYIRSLTDKQVHRLGWVERKTDDHFDQLLRPTILGLASYADNKDVVKEAMRQFETMKLPEDVHPDLRGVVYGTISRIGGRKEFDKMKAMYITSTNSEERVTLAGALTGFKQTDIISEALSMITSDHVRLQDVGYWIAYSFMNKHARTLAWDWLHENWTWLLENNGADLSFSRIPIYVSRGYSDETFLKPFKAFFESKMSPAFERPVKQAIETIEWQSAWKKRDLKQLKEFFKET